MSARALHVDDDARSNRRIAHGESASFGPPPIHPYVAAWIAHLSVRREGLWRSNNEPARSHVGVDCDLLVDTIAQIEPYETAGGLFDFNGPTAEEAEVGDVEDSGLRRELELTAQERVRLGPIERDMPRLGMHARGRDGDATEVDRLHLPRPRVDAEDKGDDPKVEHEDRISRRRCAAHLRLDDRRAISTDVDARRRVARGSFGDPLEDMAAPAREAQYSPLQKYPDAGGPLRITERVGNDADDVRRERLWIVRRRPARRRAAGREKLACEP